MDKLQRYNQKILAIIGTAVAIALAIAILSAIIGGIVALVLAISDSDSGSDKGVVLQQAEERVVGDSTRIIRHQAISFEKAIQLDTGKAEYLVPVGQVKVEGRKDEEAQRVSFSKGSYYTSHYGSYNNFLFLDMNSGKGEMIFEEKVYITDWMHIDRDGIRVLLFKGTKTDNNADKKLDDNDFMSLFVFDLNSNKMSYFPLEGHDLRQMDVMDKTDLIQLRYAKDLDLDGEFESKHEPFVLRQLDLKELEFGPMFPEEIETEMQRIVDGLEN